MKAWPLVTTSLKVSEKRWFCLSIVRITASQLFIDYIALGQRHEKAKATPHLCLAAEANPILEPVV
jgi:hypothetical protein